MIGFFKKLFEKKENSQTVRCSFVVAAAGFSERMGGQNKMFTLVGGIPILARTLIALEKCSQVSEIIVVTKSDDIVPAASICRDFSIGKVTKIVSGGETRLDSVYIGLMEVSPKAKLIGIHDGARPFVTSNLIHKTIQAASEFGASAPAIPINDTVKTAVNHTVTGTLDRDKLFAVQTPQIFLSELIKVAIKNAVAKQLKITDDCAAVEAMGASVILTEGSQENIKITTPIDLAIAEAILQMRSELQ